MCDENAPLTKKAPEEAVSKTSSPAPADEPTPPQQTPPRPQYTRLQRVMALLGAIFVIIVTLMYTYSIATGDLFFR